MERWVLALAALLLASWVHLGPRRSARRRLDRRRAPAHDAAPAGGDRGLSRAREQRKVDRLTILAAAAGLVGAGLAAASIPGLLDGGDGAPQATPTTSPTSVAGGSGGSAGPTSSSSTSTVATTTTAPPALPHRPSSTPAVLAREIEAASSTISVGEPAGAVEAAARFLQLAYRSLAGDDQLRSPTLALLPATLQPLAEANVAAGTALRGLAGVQGELPSWSIVPPPPASDLRRFYDEAEGEFGVEWEYLAAVHVIETRMGRIRGTSSAGARGPMQFLPSTWDRYGRGDIDDARDSILAAGRYLAATGAPADMDAALFAYNRSDRYVEAVQRYAECMRRDERQYLMYYHWQVIYAHEAGPVILPVGYPQSPPEPV